MIPSGPGRRLLTKDEADALFFATFEDDTEDAPWMVMGSPQYAATSDFFQSLREYAQRQQRPWFVAGMTPILYRPPGLRRRKQVAPDVFVALAPDRPRSSYDSDAEGFPPFVLEVVSPSSAHRDQREKREAYERLGVQEYALFTPNVDRPTELNGYRRSAEGHFESWPKDARGRLWSDVLGLFLLRQGMTLRAATPDGQLLSTLAEAIDAYRQAETENERLRHEVERMRRKIQGEAET